MTETAQLMGAASAPALLITESAAEYKAFHARLVAEVRPNGMIEEMFVGDVATMTWDISRLQRGKVGIVNLQFIPSLRVLLLRLFDQHESLVPHDKIDHLARNWFTDPISRKEVLDLLQQFGLDDRAIEAESIRNSLDDLANVDRMLTLLETRRSKALRSIGTCRADLAERLRQRSELLIEQASAVCLEHSPPHTDGN